MIILGPLKQQVRGPKPPGSDACQCQCQSKIFSVAKIAKLLRRPRGRSVIRAQCQEKTGEKEMFSDVDGRQTEKKMLGCRMAMSSKRVMQRPEMFVDRQLLAGMMARAVGVMMLTEVGDDWAGQRHEPAG